MGYVCAVGKLERQKQLKNEKCSNESNIFLIIALKNQ